MKYGAVNIAGLNIVPKFAEWYSYNQPGGMTPKRLQLSETIPGSIPHTTTLNFDSQYSYDGEGGKHFSVILRLPPRLRQTVKTQFAVR